MLPAITLPNGRHTTALGFGCPSLMRLPEAGLRQRLLVLSVDFGIRHFDAARLYGLGQVEAELCALLRRYSGQLTVATNMRARGGSPPIRHGSAPGRSAAPASAGARSAPSGSPLLRQPDGPSGFQRCLLQP